MFYRIAILFMLFSFVSNCEQSTAQPATLLEKRSGGKVETLPKGDELKVAIKFYKPRRAVLTIQNISSETVFVPFLPTKDGGWSQLGCEGLEKYVEKTGGFLETGCSIAGLGYHPLAAQKSLKFLIWVPESGRYRANFKYYRDQRIVDRLNSFHTLSEGEKEKLKDESEKEGKRVVSSSIDL